MPHHFSRPDDWAQHKSRDFAAWFSQLEGLRSPVAVGTRGSGGVANLAVFNSMTHIGSRPPYLALVFRPLTVERHSYDNLKATGVYTINHLPAARLDSLHATSAKYPREVSEFEACGLTPVDSATGAPYVGEGTVGMQLRFEEEYFVRANDSVVVIGRVEELRLPKEASFAESRVDWAGLDGLVVNGLYHYYRVAHERTKAYAQPESKVAQG